MNGFNEVENVGWKHESVQGDLGWWNKTPK